MPDYFELNNFLWILEFQKFLTCRELKVTKLCYNQCSFSLWSNKSTWVRFVGWTDRLCGRRLLGGRRGGGRRRGISGSDFTVGVGGPVTVGGFYTEVKTGGTTLVPGSSTCKFEALFDQL